MRTFVHDKIVLHRRIELERSLGATEWISDRKLRSGHGEQFGFSGEFVPDGVFKLPNGEWIALEVEVARKADLVYRRKVERYANLIKFDPADGQGIFVSDPRRGDSKRQRIAQVWFHCVLSKTVERILEHRWRCGDLLDVRLIEQD